ncbi:cysteine-rich protein 1 [Thamnophis elegans]|uniref:cysteine-rich protein 1 n=1 Tax=Thamnophis elegans TaxID=35005 RepID=UPI001377BD89|nr:cysteine-rich protein 1 [Thamnophis elegans]
MPKCPSCQKEVYFDLSFDMWIRSGSHSNISPSSPPPPNIIIAEKSHLPWEDWHRPCLKCEKCKKTLSAGGHAEHEGKPYCNYPCYAALFGPKGFGRGGAESYTFK